MIPEQETVERCPTCGATVEVVTADEGTSHYRPVAEVALEAAEARARKAEEALAELAQDAFLRIRDATNAALATIRDGA